MSISHTEATRQLHKAIDADTVNRLLREGAIPFLAVDGNNALHSMLHTLRHTKFAIASSTPHVEPEAVQALI